MARRTVKGAKWSGEEACRGHVGLLSTVLRSYDKNVLRNLLIGAYFFSFYTQIIIIVQIVLGGLYSCFLVWQIGRAHV